MQPTSASSVCSMRTVAYPGHSFRKPGLRAGNSECSAEMRLPLGSGPAPKTSAADPVDMIEAMSLQDASDEALIAWYRAEKDGAQSQQYVSELFRRHHVKVARWCLAFTGERESAADLAQEICAKAYQHLASFK